MKFNGKIFIVVLTIVFLMGNAVLGFATSEGEKEGVTTLTVLHYLDLADDVEAASFKEKQMEFEKQNPDIKLVFEFAKGEAFHNKLQTLSIANKLPDMMIVWPTKRSSNVTGSGKIMDLRSYIKGHEDEFVTSALDAQGKNGEIYELPIVVTAAHVMFVNTKILDELGLQPAKTLDELIKQTKTINDAGYTTVAMDNKDAWEMQSTLLGVLVERTGGKEWIKDAKAGKVKFTDSEFVRALEIIKQLQDNKVFSAGINQAEYGRALSTFNTGKAAYFIDGGWRVQNIVGEMKKELQPYVRIMSFPDIPNQKGKSQSTTKVVSSGFGMRSDLDKAKADVAWKWIWFYSGPEGSKITQKNGGLTAYKLKPSSDTPEITKRFAKFLSEKPGGYVIDAIMEGEGMGVLQPAIQQMMLGNVSPKDVAEEYENWVANNER